MSVFYIGALPESPQLCCVPFTGAEIQFKEGKYIAQHDTALESQLGLLTPPTQHLLLHGLRPPRLLQ